MQTPQSARHELREGGSFPFRVAFNDSGSGRNHVENFLYCHWHSEMEFIYVNQGQALFQIGDEEYRVGAGEALLVNSGEIHSGYSQNGERCMLHAMVFDPGMLSFEHTNPFFHPRTTRAEKTQRLLVTPLARGNNQPCTGDRQYQYQ